MSARTTQFLVFLVLARVAESFHSNQIIRLQCRPEQHMRSARLGMVGTAFGKIVPASCVPHEDADPCGANDEEITVVSKPGLSPAETRIMVQLERWYSRGLSMKCPWMRRRALDAVDAMESAALASVIKKENRGTPMSCRGDRKTNIKLKGLPIQHIAAVIREDWCEQTRKGYYITGSITPGVYRNDCVFDGPDPDMPVKGLRKFQGAASQLFDRKNSQAELISIDIEDERQVVCRWCLNAHLRLPGLPKMAEVIGTTTYHLDEDHLIYLHEETWDISAMEAFCKTDWFSTISSLIQRHEAAAAAAQQQKTTDSPASQEA